MSKPHNFFNNSINRSMRLILLAETGCDECDDLLRSAAVLSVAAYDHYFTSKFCDVLASYLRNNKPNKELLELLERSGVNTSTALEIAVMKRPFRRIRSILSNSLSGKTTHRTKAIDNLFAAMNLKGLSGRVHKRTGRKNLGRRIDKLVDTRNEVVHFAHLNSHGKPKKINSQDIRSRIEEIKLFVDTSEDIINEWVKSKNIPTVSSSTE